MKNCYQISRNICVSTFSSYRLQEMFIDFASELMNIVIYEMAKYAGYATMLFKASQDAKWFLVCSVLVKEKLGNSVDYNNNEVTQTKELYNFFA